MQPSNDRQARHYFCESLFWASQPKQAAKITWQLMPSAPRFVLVSLNLIYLISCQYIKEHENLYSSLGEKSVTQIKSMLLFLWCYARRVSRIPYAFRGLPAFAFALHGWQRLGCFQSKFRAKSGSCTFFHWFT